MESSHAKPKTHLAETISAASLGILAVVMAAPAREGIIAFPVLSLMLHGGIYLGWRAFALNKTSFMLRWLAQLPLALLLTCVALLQWIERIGVG